MKIDKQEFLNAMMYLSKINESDIDDILLVNPDSSIHKPSEKEIACWKATINSNVDFIEDYILTNSTD